MLKHLYNLTPQPEVFYEKVFLKITQLHRKAAVPESLFPATLIKKSLLRRWFPVNFAKFSVTPYLQNTSSSYLGTYIQVNSNHTGADGIVENVWEWFSGLFFFGRCKNLNPGNERFSKQAGL